jgi:hypothetical protein
MENTKLGKARPSREIHGDFSYSQGSDFHNLVAVGYVTVGESGLVSESNQTAAALIGVDRSALEGSPLSQFIFDGDQDIFEKLLESREPHQCDLRLVKPDGSLLWTQVSASFATSTEEPRRRQIVLSDISVRKATVDDINTLRAAVEQSASTIVITDLSGNIEYANPAFEKTTGYSRAEALGKNPSVLKSGKQDKEFYRELWETISSKKIWRGEFHNRRKDGSLYWESATISPVVNARGEIIHFLAIKEDITERKLLEERLADALRRAEAAAAAKTEFLGVMSHELRTPLNGVLGFAELLADTPLDDEQKSFNDTIRSSGEHLLAIVNDILDFASIEHGSIAIHPVPFVLADVVESSVVAIRQAAAEKEIALRCEIATGVPGEINGDERRIRQILLNLLGNALKFTDRGSIVLRIAPVSGDRFLEFSVEDTGIGMSAETLQGLFKPFAQGNSTTSRPYGGTGLGLAISKRLAEAMDASLTATSTLGKGSTFAFRLPLNWQKGTGNSVLPHHPAEPTTKSGRPGDGGLILVADDDRNSALLTDKMLEGLGYRAQVVSNGAEALRAFVPGRFFAILMDMAMPEMNGLEATGRIREVEAGLESHVPIIALTANVLPEDRDRCLAAGMDDFLTKPYKQAQLAAKLGNIAKR